MPNELSEREKQDNEITLQYRYLKELSGLAYEAEEKREQNLIQQASQMQTAFSFMIAAVFMAAPFFIDFFGERSKTFFYVSTFLILILLLISLLLASVSQWRWKSKSFVDIPKIKDALLEDPNWEKMCLESYQSAQYIDWIGSIQVCKARLNERRVRLIMASMICLYVSVVALIICIVTGTLIFLGGIQK